MESKRKRQLEECVIRILEHGDMNRMTESKVRKLAAEETGFDLMDPVNVKIVKRTVRDFFVKAQEEGGGSHNKKAPAKDTSAKSPVKQQPTAQLTRRRKAVVVDEDEEEEEVEDRRMVSNDAELDDNSEEEDPRRVKTGKHSGQRPARKRVSISESSEDEKQPPKKQSNDSNDSIVCQLSKTRSVSVQEFKGKTLVSILEYYEKDGRKLPTPKGISLTLEQWEAFKEGIPDIEAAIIRLER